MYFRGQKSRGQGQGRGLVLRDQGQGRGLVVRGQGRGRGLTNWPRFGLVARPGLEA